jgi:peptide/nickel transport system permease protein
MSSWEFAPLWTDWLVYLLFVTSLLLGGWVSRSAVLAAPWRRVGQSPLAMVSLVMLVPFFAVGLLDSLHFRAVSGEAQGQVRSVFDFMLGDLPREVEKTYSAPLATHLLARETVINAAGQVERLAPRLQYGGAHLADPVRDRNADLLARSVSGALSGALVWLLVCVVPVLLWQRAAWLDWWRRTLAGRQCWPARSVLVTLLLLAILAGMAVSLAQGYHLLGTDKVGNDVLYISLKSIRTGLVIGTLTTLVTLPLAIGFGLAAGYFGGWVDDAIQYVYTVLNSIPGVLLIAAAVLVTQVYIETHAEWFDSSEARADVRLLALCMILGMTSWTGLARLLRGEALKLRALEYVEAARAFGVSGLRILLRHLLPNVFHIVLISVVMDFSGLVLAEAVLSYVGVGVDPASYSWGNMINGARLELAREPVVWWQLVAAFGFMFVLVLAANLFADVVREAFDPRLGRSA